MDKKGRNSRTKRTIVYWTFLLIICLILLLIRCSCTSNNTAVIVIPKPTPQTLFVEDHRSKWAVANTLEIFKTTEKYVVNGKIAPGLSGNYEFFVKNKSGLNILYGINFQDENKQKMDMRYRLLENDKYIVGDAENWKAVADLNTKLNHLSIDETKTYLLEWKWFEGPNDTKYGIEAKAIYKLEILITAEEDV